MSKKIVVIGSTGQLARELQTLNPLGDNVVFLSRQEADLSANTFIENVKAQQPDVIINAAAYTAVDKAESEQELANQVNGHAVSALANLCKEIDARLIHVSTDFVFDGSSSIPYMPSNQTNPLSVYGSSKLIGEEKIQELLEDYLIIRTSWVYSSYGNNFVKTMLRLMADRDELNVVADQIGSPTYARGLASLIYRAFNDTSLTGVCHYSDLGVASWYDFAVAIQEMGVKHGMLDNDHCQINPIPAVQYPTPATRPSYSVLDKSILLENYRDQFVHWREALMQMFQELNRD